MSGLRCPKCEGVMEVGYMPDLAGGFTFPPSYWVEGPPKKITWTIRNRRRLPITAYRCTACGYLELYATGERKKKNEDGV
jgi:hypothetical protein